MKFKDVLYLPMWQIILKLHQSVSKSIANFLPTQTNLSVILATIMAFLLPIVIALFQSVRSDDWDAAIVLKKIINFKQLSFFVAFMLTPFFVPGKNDEVNVETALLFVIGMIGTFVILSRCIRWLLDWSSPENGYKNGYRKNILTDSGLSSSEIVTEWKSMADSYAASSVKMQIQVDELYKYIRMAYELLESRHDEQQYMVEFVESVDVITKEQTRFSGVVEDKLRTFLLIKLEKFDREQWAEQWKLLSSLQRLVQNRVMCAMKDEYNFYVISRWMKDMLLEAYKRPQKDLFIKRLEYLIPQLVDIVYERNNISDSDDLDQIDFRVSSNITRQDTAYGKIQYYIVKTSLEKFESIKAKDNFWKIDNYINVMFRSADPITLGILFDVHTRLKSNLQFIDYLKAGKYELFFENVFEPARKFGYSGRVETILGESTPEDSMKEFERQMKEYEFESIEIAIDFLCMLKYDNFVQKLNTAERKIIKEVPKSQKIRFDIFKKYEKKLEESKRG